MYREYDEIPVALGIESRPGLRRGYDGTSNACHDKIMWTDGQSDEAAAVALSFRIGRSETGLLSASLVLLG